ncbi:28S ribosomal mitochondrial [Brachionus plicatilis]|uniref:Small ribosomal subunit protein uS15m n=1 Tax=Brachionus plicatilis TaxID=10195 RepID=A0A3M7PMS6_BRAPC|nr:28S ribosomal mitochondrial [Brachionus plicatilis]
MACLIGKKILGHNLFSLNHFYKVLPNSAPCRGIITQNEQDWIKENSQKLLEKVKNEKSIELNIEQKSPQLYFDKSAQLKNADDVVKKILSLEYASKNDFKRYENYLIQKEFQRLPNEQDSLEIQISLHTINIRRMVKNLEDCNGKNKTVEFFLYRQIHRRDRLMLQLFYKDNKRFEWLKEKLNLKDYELQETHPYKRVTRYEKFIAEVKQSTREKRLDKLEQLKSEFENKKKQFLAEKSQVLAEIQQEIKELGFEDIQFPQY